MENEGKRKVSDGNHSVVSGSFKIRGGSYKVGFENIRIFQNFLSGWYLRLTKSVNFVFVEHTKSGSNFKERACRLYSQFNSPT